MASLGKKNRSSSTPKLNESTEDLKEKNMNEKAVLEWKCPTKETLSSRLRREMNAGKGARIRSRTAEEEIKGKWVQEKVTEQMKMIKAKEVEILEFEKKIKLLEENLSKCQTKLEEVTNSNLQKDKQILRVEEEKQTAIREIEDLKSQTKKLQMQISTIEGNQSHMDNSIQKLLEEIANKDQEIQQLKKILEKEQSEKSSLNTRYTSAVQDQSEMNQTLQREIQLLKDEIDGQVTSTNILKKSLESQLKEKDREITTFQDEISRLLHEHEMFQTEIESSNSKEKVLHTKIQEAETQLQNTAEENKKLQEAYNRYENEMQSQVQESDSLTFNLKNQVKELKNELDLLGEKNVNLEETCQDYEKELGDRIKENLTIMDEYDNAKAEECKQLNFINKLTNSNQELTNMTREQKTDIENMKKKIIQLEKENLEEQSVTTKLKTAFDQEKKQSESLQVQLSQCLKETDAKDLTIIQLNETVNAMDAKLQETTEKLEVTFQEREKFANDSKTFENWLNKKVNELKQEKERFDKRDKEQTQFMSQLADDLENLKQHIIEKTETIDRLELELVDEKENSFKINQSQSSNIQELQKLLSESQSKVTIKTSNIDKLNEENRELNAKLTQKMAVLETLKLENANFKSNFEQSEQMNETLNAQLNDVMLNFLEKEQECENLKSKLESCDETVKQQGIIFNDLRQQIEMLTKNLETREREVSDMEQKVGERVDKYNDEIARTSEAHVIAMNELREELQTTRTKSQQELEELLNNFSEVENELTFCQEELISKSHQINELRTQLTEMTKSAISKEQKLLQDLETLNEQNEKILQNGIEKFRVESERQIQQLQLQCKDQVNQLQNHYDAKISSIEEKHKFEEEKKIESLNTLHFQQLEQTQAEREHLKLELQNKSASQEQLESNYNSKIRSKEAELTTKTRIIDQLGRRIDTQQKLIEYMMKSLESERSKQQNANGDILTMLSNLQTTLDDRLDCNSEFLHVWPGSSVSSQLSSEGTISPGPLPIISRGYQSSTSESVVSPLPSPTVSPFLENFNNEDFKDHLTSSPLTLENPNSTYSWLQSREVKSSCKHSKSIPETTFMATSYESPTTEGTSRTIYFGEQIRMIIKTFEKIESVQTENSPNKELNLDIWKQKIHFRLKVLEDQLSEIEGSGTGQNGYLRKKRDNVTFYPTTQEIRDLIDNVNKRYQNLGKST